MLEKNTFYDAKFLNTQLLFAPTFIGAKVKRKMSDKSKFFSIF